MRPVSLAQVVTAALEGHTNDVHTATIGRVTAYRPATQRADIEVCVARPLQNPQEEVVYEAVGTLPDVPVLFPRTKKYSLVFPLDVGDTVLLVYCESSIAEWRTGARTGEPADTRRHSSGYPVAIPGVFPDLEPAVNGTAVPGAFTLGHETSTAKIEITQAGIALGHLASDFVALSSKVDAALAAIVDKLNSHVHPGVTAGAASTGTIAAVLPAQPSTASILTKSL